MNVAAPILQIRKCACGRLVCKLQSWDLILGLRDSETPVHYSNDGNADVPSAAQVVQVYNLVLHLWMDRFFQLLGLGNKLLTDL